MVRPRRLAPRQALRLRLALARLDALTRAQHPDRPHRNQFHERDGGRLLFLRWRQRRGAFAGADDRRDPEPLPLPALAGYCRACGVALDRAGDLCPLCAAPLVAAITVTEAD